ncbi:BREX-1 system adenine-specific DNA-methyltransferase PglX, partial [Rhodospirillales bacterium]|nr:BREX-1 system adenine-specific DNA-methyltransferase PglX [Rhodospirillales bacterium]
MSINRNALKNYAPKARQDFISAITARAAKFGIGDGEPVPMLEQGDVVIIGGEAFSKKIGTQRKALLEHIRLHGFGQTMEEVAYTWFNRFIAIRYMELHGYLDHGFRVLSNQDGSGNPEILQNAGHLELVGLDKPQVNEFLMDGTKDVELYRLLLVAQCNAMHDAMPFLFEKIDDETELLLPDNLLHSDSLIRQLVNEIDESYWQEIEIIGWLYQFYISEKKNEVIGKVVKSEDIPAATQLFTPNWIVKYMVQNSLGHQWMATHPSSSLKDDMEYYIEPAEQTPEVQAQLAEITQKELNPEELTLLDPAAGSGHILVEAYDLFKQIYLERGYRLKDIPRLILEKNLYGLDIDDRAAQMAGFALLMKARADDRRILSNPVHLNVMAIQSSEGMDAADIAKDLLPTGRYELVASDDLLPDTLAQPTLAANATSDVKAGTIESLINLFKDAKTFGSLITVPDKIQKSLPALGQLLDQITAGDLLQQQLREYAVRVVRPLMKQANVLGRQYNCVVANPPYMGIGGMNGSLKTFAKQHFKGADQDLYSMFMIRALSQGKTTSLVSMHSWMFTSRFEGFRFKLQNQSTIRSIAHLGSGAFPEISGEVVKTAISTIDSGRLENNMSVFLRLVEGNSSAKSDSIIHANAPRFERLQAEFSNFPNSVFAYWASAVEREAILLNARIEKNLIVREGMATADNDRFIRNWAEVSVNSIGFGIGDIDQSIISRKRWFPYQKGGSYRKWYGNNDLIVDWESDGAEIRNLKDEKTGRIRSHNYNGDYAFKTGMTWTAVSSGNFGARFIGGGCLFDSKGTMAFSDYPIQYFIGLLNSAVGGRVLCLFSPTMDFRVGHILSVPLPSTGIPQSTEVNTDNLIEISKSNWDDFETSWDFSRFPMLNDNQRRSTTEGSFNAWQAHCNTNIQTMQELEEENNRIFIEAYGLQAELTPDVPEDQITLARADREEDIKLLMSYAVGCMMGRYSLAEEGLIYANSGNEGFGPSRYGDFSADDDGIIPITDAEWFDDDATVRFE